MYVVCDMYARSYINVYKSSDGGTTWSAIQQNLGPFNNDFQYNAYDIISVGTDIVAVYQSTFSKLAVRIFSMVTDTWGTENHAGPNGFNGSETGNDPLVRTVRDSATGDLFVFYTEWLTTNQTINYTKYNGSTWTANTVLVPSSGTIFNFLGTAFQDSNGLIHVYYRKAATDTPSAALYHATLTTAGVAVVNNLVSATLATYPTGRAFEYGGTQNFIYYDSNARTGLWVGNSLGSTPTWAFTLVNTTSFPAGVNDIGPQVHEAGSPTYGAKGFAFVSGGHAYVIWQSTSDTGSSSDYSTNRVYRSINSGSGWSTPDLLLDQYLHPGPFGTPDKLFALTANISSTTLYVLLDINCSGLYIFNAPANPLAIICNSPPSGQVGVAYTHSVSASGGTSPYTYSLIAGAIPGLSFSSSGAFTGTPTAAGTYLFTLQVTDAASNTATVICTIIIAPAPALSLLCNNPPSGTVSEAYSHQLTISGGVSPYVITLLSGTFPAGLMISATGLITGTPSAAGVYPFTILVTDAQAIPLTATLTCTIVISSGMSNCPDLINPQIPGFIVPLDPDIERYLRRFINDPASASTPPDQN